MTNTRNRLVVSFIFNAFFFAVVNGYAVDPDDCILAYQKFVGGGIDFGYFNLSLLACSSRELIVVFNFGTVKNEVKLPL